MAPSALVDSMFTSARERLWLDFEEATSRSHMGNRGNARADAIAELLRERLPSTFATITRGEAVDPGDRHSRELDVVTFDSLRNPVLSKKDLLPAEALLSVIEVKSELTLPEMRKAVEVARSIRALEPFGMPFIGSRRRGTGRQSHRYRCFVTLFAYRSSLKETDWLVNEWRRYRTAVGVAGPLDLIDMIIVLDSGTIRPPDKSGKVDRVGKGSLHLWFVSLANFLARENARRPAMDWEAYLSRYGKGWQKLQ